MAAEDVIIMPFNDAAAVERILDRREGNALFRRLKVHGQMNRGIFIAPRGMGCTSSVMTQKDVDGFLQGLEGALIEDPELGA